MAAFQISKGWRHEKARLVILLLGNCRAAVISFFSTYYHLFSYPRNKVQCPCVGYIFLPSSIKQLSTIQGSMSLCWTHYFIHYHLTLHHPTAHFTSIYFFNGVSLLQTGINKPIDLSNSSSFYTNSETREFYKLCLIRSSCMLFRVGSMHIHIIYVY